MNKEKLLISAILFKYNVPVEEAKIVGTYINQLENQNVAYKNMRKDLLDLILYQYPALSQSESDFKDDLLNILNKVGEDNENN